MPRNKLIDLNDHLFEQLERLNDEDLTPEQLEMETKRAKAMSGIATNIINNVHLALEIKTYSDEYGVDKNGDTPLLTNNIIDK